jgi:hypothetical protein
MRAQTKSISRFFFFSGLLLFEACLVIAFYVIPQFQSHEYITHPNIGLELDSVFNKYRWLKVAFVGFLGVFLLGNIGLIVTVWRTFKNLRAETRNR